MTHSTSQGSPDTSSHFPPEAFDYTLIPDYDCDFVNESDIHEFTKAIHAPENANDEFTALNDWRPVYQRTRRREGNGPSRRTGATRRRTRSSRRGVDEKREGYVYTILQWPLLVIVMAWIIVLGVSYLLTRLYIWLYEQGVSMRGRRQQLRLKLRGTTNYPDWVEAAKTMDRYLGNERWKTVDAYAYYDSVTVKRVRDEMRASRQILEKELEMEKTGGASNGNGHDSNSKYRRAAEDLKGLLEAALKGNFAGVENPRLYSETYYGTKELVQSYIDEAERSLAILSKSLQLPPSEKAAMFEHLSTNYGRTALCLSGGATFAYYHFGIAKAMLDAGVLPEVITGTSGGALVAALLGTRTDDELKRLLVPALAGRIKACSEPFTTWFPRWWRTGARFDSVDWARRCSWFCHGSLTFREAYQRTGRILNVTCVPSDPHSPAILANYLTSPDCVIWSAVLASAAVPGILNPVVLMRKTRDGSLVPYSFGHKWKDGSLRTDIPLKALNTHFNVSFSVVSQVNPHVNLFFFSSRGTVGRPVTHRRGRGWRGGFLGSATEQYLKLDLTKWLKVLRHLELLPRPLGQDWSQIWLQRFSGTITIWPRTRFWEITQILSDPSPKRLAHMIHQGQLSTFPKLKFILNRMMIERLIDAGRRENGLANPTSNLGASGGLSTNSFLASRLLPSLSEEDLEALLDDRRRKRLKQGATSGRAQGYPPPAQFQSRPSPRSPIILQPKPRRASSPTLSQRLSNWFAGVGSGTGDGSKSPQTSFSNGEGIVNEHIGREHPSADPSSATGSHDDDMAIPATWSHRPRRSSNVMQELKRQSGVFFDDTEEDEDEGDTSLSEEGEMDMDATYETGPDSALEGSGEAGIGDHTFGETEHETESEDDGVVFGDKARAAAAMAVSPGGTVEDGGAADVMAPQTHGSVSATGTVSMGKESGRERRRVRKV